MSALVAGKFSNELNNRITHISRLTTIWVDGGNDYEPFMQWVMNFCRWIVQVVLRPEETKGNVKLKKRWVVERTNGIADGMSAIG